MSEQMTREHVLQILRERLPMLHEKYGVRQIALFGSFARETQTERSDVDILVEFSTPLGFAFVRLAEELESLLHKKVDLATFETFRCSKQDPRRRHIAERIEKELIYVK